MNEVRITTREYNDLKEKERELKELKAKMPVITVAKTISAYGIRNTTEVHYENVEEATKDVINIVTTKNNEIIEYLKKEILGLNERLDNISAESLNKSIWLSKIPTWILNLYGIK